MSYSYFFLSQPPTFLFLYTESQCLRQAGSTSCHGQGLDPRKDDKALGPVATTWSSSLSSSSSSSPSFQLVSDTSLHCDTFRSRSRLILLSVGKKNKQ